MDSNNNSPVGLDFKKLYLAWFGLIFSTLIIFIIGGIVRGDPAPPILRLNIVSDFSLFAIILYVIGSMVAVYILKNYLNIKGMSLSDIGITKQFPKSSFLYIVVGIIIGSFLYTLVEYLLQLVNVNMYWRSVKTTYIILNTPVDPILTIIFAVIIGPICEEIIFRGYVLTTFLKKGYKNYTAILLSSLIFTSVHIYHGPGVLLFIFFWSFIPSILYLKYKSLFPAMLMHSINNTIAYILVPIIFH